jgi:thymidylate synthase (FAD)
MKIKFIKPSFEINMLGQTGIEKLKHIEKVARTCYKSEDKITDTSYEKMIAGLIKRKHLAMMEFGVVHVKFIANRAFSHELVRHRVASFAQESQRYVGYGDVIEFIIPSWTDIKPFEFEYKDSYSLHDILGEENYHLVPPELTWISNMIYSSEGYTELIEMGWKPEQARDVLPNACKTEINFQTNLRELMLVQDLRDHHTASPQMRELMEPFFIKLGGMIPGVFR